MIDHDTVSEKGDATLAGDRAAVIRGSGLSASDSGRLVNTGTKSAVDLFGDSFLDLEVESGYKGSRSSRSAGGKSSTLSGRRSDGARIVPGGAKATAEILSGSKIGEDLAGGSGGYHSLKTPQSAGKSPAARPGANRAAPSGSADNRSSGFFSNPILVGLSLGVFFLLAIVIGYVLARLTS